MLDLLFQKMKENRCNLSTAITKFEGSHVVQTVEGVWAVADNKQQLEFLGTTWSLNAKIAKVDGNENALDCEFTYNLVKGSLSEAGVAVNIAFANWSKENYVLIPGAAYNGNRFKVSKQPYPPMLVKEEIGVDIPVTITDVPRLNIGDGKSEIQFLAGDMATPTVGFYSPQQKRGFFIVTTQASGIGDNGIAIKENSGKTQAVITISAPGMRNDFKYGMCTTEEISDDRGHDFNENDEVTLKFRMYFFDCADIAGLFSYFINIRKDLTGRVELHHQLTFSKAWEIQQEKYNRDNWHKELKFYRVSPSDSIFGEWQTGWVGGGMSSYPMLFEGNELSKERALKNLDFAFEKAQAPNGFFYGIVYQGKPYGDYFQGQDDLNWLLLRKNADIIYFITKQFMLMDKLGIEVQIKWKAGLEKACDALLRLWNKYGQFGQFIQIDREEIITGGTASAGIAPAGLALAGQYLGKPEYLDIAIQSAEYYYNNFTLKGLTNGAPGEICQCPDSEAAFALLESYIVLYETTGSKRWLDMAVNAANQCATWCISYDFKYPKDTAFAKYGMHTAGAVFANAQNKHGGPGICTLSGDTLFKLYRATGNRLYLELIQEIAHNLPQYLSREDRPLCVSWSFDNNDYNGDGKQGQIIPPGWMNERVNTSDWEGKGNIGGVPGGSCWCEVSNMLTFVEVPGLYIQKDTGFICAIDHVEAEIIENSTNNLVVKIKNPTDFSARVKVFAENSSDMSKPLGQNAMLSCDKVEIMPHSEKKLTYVK